MSYSTRDSRPSITSLEYEPDSLDKGRDGNKAGNLSMVQLQNVVDRTPQDLGRSWSKGNMEPETLHQPAPPGPDDTCTLGAYRFPGRLVGQYIYI